MQQAKKQGLACSNGIRMLVKQAALSFILWNDLPSNTLAGIETSMHQAISHMVEL
jgi:shikimate 5-dehydrogenase